MVRKMERTKVIDIDGILTKETEGFSESAYKNRTPNKRNITVVRDLKKRGFKIILHTARFKIDRELTVDWLKKHNVPYDELILGKPQAETYYDDKASNVLDQEVICFSGGIDSLIAWHYLNFPKPIYIKINHKYQEKEIKSIKTLESLIPKLKVEFIEGPDLSQFEVGDKAYISQRNLHLALMASHYGNKIYINGIKGDNVEDKNKQAFKTMSFAMNSIKKESEPTISIDSPFWNMTKTDIIKWYRKNYDELYVRSTLKMSVSCYDSTILGSCGRCPSCFRKWIAIENAGIDARTYFESDITEWSGIQLYVKKMKQGMYDQQRTLETKTVLKKYNLW